MMVSLQFLFEKLQPSPEMLLVSRPEKLNLPVLLLMQHKDLPLIAFHAIKNLYRIRQLLNQNQLPKIFCLDNGPYCVPCHFSFDDGQLFQLDLWSVHDDFYCSQFP